MLISINLEEELITEEQVNVGRKKLHASELQSIRNRVDSLLSFVRNTNLYLVHNKQTDKKEFAYYPKHEKQGVSKGTLSKYLFFPHEYVPSTHPNINQQNIHAYRDNEESLYSKYKQGELYVPFLVPIVLDSQKIYLKGSSDDITTIDSWTNSKNKFLKNSVWTYIFIGFKKEMNFLFQESQKDSLLNKHLNYVPLSGEGIETPAGKNNEYTKDKYERESHKLFHQVFWNKENAYNKKQNTIPNFGKCTVQNKQFRPDEQLFSGYPVLRDYRMKVSYGGKESADIFHMRQSMGPDYRVYDEILGGELKKIKSYQIKSCTGTTDNHLYYDQTLQDNRDTDEFTQKINHDWWIYGSNIIKEGMADRIVSVGCHKELFDVTYRKPQQISSLTELLSSDSTQSIIEFFVLIILIDVYKFPYLPLAISSKLRFLWDHII